MIDYSTIERIQSAAQIYDVVSDFITLRKSGANYKGLCPFHEDRTPSFMVSPAKNICKCFACGEGGTPIHFIMKHEQLSYPEALKYLAKKYGIEVHETELTDEQKQVQSDREAMFILNGFAQKTFSFNLYNTEEGTSLALSYFRERGLREDIIQKFQLGYALEARDSFTKEALKAGYKREYLEKTGLTIVGTNDYLTDRFRGRVIFPVHTLSGKVVAFGGRILKKAENTGKYVNSPESEIYHKSNELYGLYFARQAMVKQDFCFLVEGYMDLISMHQAGIENVVAASGTALPIGQIRLIRRFTNNVTAIYDGDTAGRNAALKNSSVLLEAGLNVKVVMLPEGEDPDSFSKKQSASDFGEYIKEHEIDFVLFKVHFLLQEAGSDPIKKARIITEIVDTIALIPEEIIRLVYVKECSKLLDMDERMLVRNIAKKRQDQLLQKKPTLYPDPENPEEPSKSTQSASSEETFQPETKPEAPFEEYEKNIMYYVIRYGEQYFTYKDEETQETVSINVIEFIASDLKCDEIEFQNRVYKKILEESFLKYKEEGFVAELYFKNHPDPDISHFAVDISTDRYVMSKIHFKHKKVEMDKDKAKLEKQAELDKMLREQVPYVMVNYKDAMLKQQTDEINHQIKRAGETNNTEELDRLMVQLRELWRDFKKEIALHLHERIVPKI
jgi:DNA primase